MKKFFAVMSIFTSGISFIICLLYSSNIDSAFLPIVLYPIIYGVFATILFILLNDQNAGGRITVSIFLGLQWIRNVLLPAMGAISGYFITNVGLIDENSASKASYLCACELIVTSIICCLILKFSKKNPKNHTFQMSLSGSWQIYLAYVFFALVLFFFFGKGMYSFFVLPLTGNRASIEEISSTDVILRSMIGYGLTFFVILVVFFSYKKYRETHQKKYMRIALGCVLLRLCIISSSSEGRLAVVYLFGTFLLLLPHLFPRYSKSIVRRITIITVAVIGLMTVYKTFQAFFYDSYVEAIQKNVSDFGLESATSTINVYFYGVQNVAKNLYVSQFTNNTIKTLFNDLVQNTFGIHYLFRNSGNTTIAMYNLYIYNGTETAGHLYSSIAYGAQYFGVILAPIATIINILLSAFIENKLKYIQRIDVYYVVCISYVRFATTMFSCFPMIWNYASRNLVLGFIVIGLSSIFMLRKNNIYIRENEKLIFEDGGIRKNENYENDI